MTTNLVHELETTNNPNILYFQLPFHWFSVSMRATGQKSRWRFLTHFNMSFFFLFGQEEAQKLPEVVNLHRLNCGNDGREGGSGSLLWT